MSTTNTPRIIDRLIFVYAANSGRLGAFVDSAKKLLQVRGCSLCALTHGLTGEKEEWRSCRDEIGVPIDTYHLDDQPSDVERVAAGAYPCVLAKSGDELMLLLGPDTLDRLRGSVNDLRARLDIHATMRGLELPEGPPAAA
ncbi:MAG: hypothetical protein MPN21_15730 [Thermoanaerobaculia bacterium]|nr:hypothetical protein [Thermoanaerobaculia bacterium]